MRTATRIVLLVTGTAILIGAMATPGARAGRSHPDEAQRVALSVSQRALPQSRPGRIDYVSTAKPV